MRLQDFIFLSNYQHNLLNNMIWEKNYRNLKKFAGLCGCDYLCGMLFALYNMVKDF